MAIFTIDLEPVPLAVLRDVTSVFSFLTQLQDASYLTLRLLMSYIYIYMEHPFLMFLDHTQRRTIVGRTPLDE